MIIYVVICYSNFSMTNNISLTCDSGETSVLFPWNQMIYYIMQYWKIIITTPPSSFPSFSTILMFFSAPQMRPLGCVSHQRNGSSGSCPLCPGHANPVHRPDLAAGTSSRTRTQTPTEPHPRHSAAGLLPCTRQHKPGHTHFVKMTPSWGGGVVLMIAKILVELDSKP